MIIVQYKEDSFILEGGRLYSEEPYIKNIYDACTVTDTTVKEGVQEQAIAYRMMDWLQGSYILYDNNLAENSLNEY